MTDLEINKALVLAIGYHETHITVVENRHGESRVWVYRPTYPEHADKPIPYSNLATGNWWMFNYENWQTISPIAEHYDAFPFFCDCGAPSWWIAGVRRHGTDAGQGADTPQKAIAMAVIRGAKK